MTAPDHRPYLRPGVDLVTAEDACAWLDGLTSGPARERIYGVLDAHAALSLRLDRERRQACRRGALDAWRLFRSWVHEWGYDPMEEGGEEAAECLADALAFRAAARAR